MLVEREQHLMTRASLVNQARIHRGYHYPRSVLTGMRSAANFSRFVEDFAVCVNRAAPSLYAIARRQSNVTSSQFRRFCEIIGAPLEAAPAHIHRLFDKEMIEDVFLVEEHTFNALLLRSEMERRLLESGVRIETATSVERLVPLPGHRVRVVMPDRTVETNTVLICCYASINALLERSGLETVPMRHEFVEMALIEPAPALRNIGVTLMCGPFFSTLPFPSRGDLHTLSHVRYTPHYAWSSDESVDADRVQEGAERKSRYAAMIRDAARYLPVIKSSRYVDSLWEVKAILPRSDSDDSRPILFVQHTDRPAIVSIMGAKIDNVYDACDVLDTQRNQRAAI